VNKLSALVHNEEITWSSADCYRSLAEVALNIYSYNKTKWVIKSRRMRWAGHVARMGEERGCIGYWWGNRREGDHWGVLGVDGG